MTDALGAYSEYSYDRLGNVTKSVAKNSSGAILRETIAEWNSIGLPLSTATMSGSVALATTYAYDAAGQIIRQTDPLGHTQTYSYDSLGRLMSEIDALGNTISYAYDVRSLLVSRTVSGSGGLSVATHMAYDGDGRLVREWRTQSGAELATSYRYDAAGRLTLAVGPE